MQPSLFSATEKMLRASAGILPAESAHMLGIAVIESPVLRRLAGLGAVGSHQHLTAELPVAGLCFPNPLGVAAGFDKDGRIAGALLAAGFGFVECGTITPRPQEGNPRPRLFRLRADRALINRMGFNGQGLQRFRHRMENLPRDLRSRIGVNIGANRDSQRPISDYAEGIATAARLGAYLTLNISSPNTPGLKLLQGDNAFDELLDAADQAVDNLPSGTRPPVFVKISADFAPDALGRLIERAIASSCVRGLVVANTMTGRPEGLQSRHACEAGGLSGAPIFARNTEVLRDAARMCAGRLDLIGAGGVEDAYTAYAKLRAGARMVQVYTGLVYRGAPMIGSILTGLAEMMRADGASSIADVVGADL